MSHYERFARNAMMYDFGFDNSEEDENVIQGWIDYLDRTFDLVLITDYFDESMVLMKVSSTVYQTITPIWLSRN